MKDKPEDFANQCGYGRRFFTYPVTADQILSFQNSRSDSLFFSIFYDDNIIGSLELITYINDQIRNKECTLARFLICDEYKYKGNGTLALNILVKYAFDELKMNTVKLAVFDFNDSAHKCYQKAGFIETTKDVRDNGWVVINMEIQNPANRS